MSAPGFVPIRQLVLVDLLGLMLATRPGERATVAIDGPDGVGKTHLARELVALAGHVAGRDVAWVSVDGFHHPREVRYARGRTGQTCYQDSYDYEALRDSVLRPFRDGRAIVPAAFDVQADRPVAPEPVELGEDCLLLVEGVFLRRPELWGEWDATCLVTAPGVEDPSHPGTEEYVEAQRIYRLQSRTWAPDWIVDNTDLARPQLIVPDPDEPQWFEQ